MWRAAKSDEVRVHVARVLEERAETFGEETIATRLRGPSEGVESTAEHVRWTFARLWVLEWRARGTGASQAIEEINSAPAGIVRAAMLRALAELLTLESELDILAIMPKQSIAVQWEWVNHMLSSLIAAYAERGEGAGSLASAVAVRAADIAASGSRAPARSPEGRQEEVVQMRGALRAANLAPVALASLLRGRAGPDDPDAWLDHDRLGTLLAAGAIGGHLGAGEALSQMVAHPSVADRRVVARARKDLERYASENQVAGVALLDLAIADADTLRLHRRLPEIHQQSPSLVQERAERLVDLRRRLTESRDRDQRAGGYQLQARLVELGLEATPEQAWLDRRLQREHDHRSLVHLIGVVAASARLGKGPAAEILDRLMELTEAEHAGVRTAAFTAAADVAVARWREVGVARVLDVAVAEPVTADRVPCVGYVVDELASEDPAAAVTLLVELLDRSLATALSPKGQRDVGTRLRRTLRNLFAVSSPADRTRLLRAAAGRGEGYARALIEGACRAHFVELQSVLDEVLGDELVHHYAKRLIRDTKRSRERTSGNGGWPELYEI
jgi:hypothetical protein